MSQPTPNKAVQPSAAKPSAASPVEKITRGDALAQSQDTAAENRRKLMELFPGVLTETDAGLAVDAAALAGYVGAVADDDRRERFGLAWHGKSAARRLALTPSAGTLRPAPDQSNDFDTTGNVLIEGDNLEALKLLQKAYSGKVKLIYIDPPYNTGNDFVYKDDFRDPIGQYQRIVGDTDDEGAALTSNTDTGGRFHTTWLNMIFPRLLLARELLRNDGVIAISIDDEEQHRLREVCDDIFGAENFVASIVWQKRYVSNVTAKYFSDMHDFVHVYSRSVDVVSVADWDRTDEQLEAYRNPDDDPRGRWRAQDLSASKFYSAGQFKIVGPTGKVFEPPPNRYWRCNEQQFEKWKADNRIWWGVNADARPMLKAFLEESERGLKPHTWWEFEFAGHNKEATLEMKDLFDGDSPFDTPKPVRLLKRITDAFCGKDDLILDFFAGSGTTGHAVMAQNAADGGNRKFVLVQLPEPTGRADYPTIADLTAERLRRAGAKLKSEHNSQLTAAGPDAKPLDTGFRVFKLDSANVKAWAAPTTDNLTPETIEGLIEGSIDAVRPDRSDADLLWGVMLNLGLPLDGAVTTRTIDSKTVHVAGGGTLLACFAKSIDLPGGERLAVGLAETIRDLGVVGEVTVLLRDAAFAGNDAAKVNLVENLKQRLPEGASARVRSI